MMLTVAGEDYRIFNELILFIRVYIFKLNLRIPKQYTAEKVLWLISGFDSILRKVLAQQPPEMRFTDFTAGRLADYFNILDSLKEPTPEEEKAFIDNVNRVKAVKDFLEKKIETEAGEFVKKLAEEEYIRAAKARMTAVTGKAEERKSKTFVADLRAGQVRVADFKELWKLASRSAAESKVYPEIKNALIEAGYFMLIERDELKALVMENQTYANLNSSAKDRLAEFIVNCLGLFEEGERKKLYEVAHMELADHIGIITGAGRDLAAKGEQMNIIRVFKMRKAEKIRENLGKIMETLKVSGNIGLFYVNYDLKVVEESDFDGIDYTVDASVEYLNKDVELNPKEVLKQDLWNNQYLRFAWFSGTVWFRWEYNRIENERKIVI